MRIERTAKTVIAGLMSVACLASVAACGPGSSSNKANTETEAVSTDLGDTKYELKLWDGAGLKTFDDQLIEAFQKKYPNITIKATYDPDNPSQQNGPRIISAPDTPDIARITDINSAVRGNHVVNLDAYADAYGWKLPDSQTQVYRVGSDAGKLAMMMPAKEGGTSYIYQALLTNYEGRDTVQDWIIQKDGATFNTDGAVKAAQKIKDWQDAGYFSSDALALDGSTALSRFCNGEALFFPSGSWYSASINDALGDDAGWIAFPGEKADSGSAAANAVTAFGIPANAKNKNAAAAFLDFLQSDEARQIAVDNGYPPVGEGETPSTDNQLLGQVLTAYEGLVKTGNTTDYINNATAGMQASAIIPGFQSLIDGTMTPKAFVESIQAQYEKEVK